MGDRQDVPIPDDRAGSPPARRGPVAGEPVVERTYEPDRDAMLAALRIVLRLPGVVAARKDWADE
jgi:hypothetical protein